MLKPALKSEEKKRPCPHSPGVFRGFAHDDLSQKIRLTWGNLPCKSWACPVCSEKKIKNIRRRVFRGPLLAAAEVPGYRAQFAQKFLTLTYPGDDYRSRFTPDQALDQMSSAWNKLRTALKKFYGAFAYFKILERQKDGFPHFHVLIVGRNIASKGILEHIEKLWRDHYAMGFVRLNVITNDLKHGIRYATKYLTKQEELKGRPNIRRYARLFTASRGALEGNPMKRKYDHAQVVFGYCTGDDDWHEEEIDALPITKQQRDYLAEPLRVRVCQDETFARDILRHKTKIRRK